MKVEWEGSKKMPSIPELMGKIPEFTRRAKLHDEITVKILEIVNEINVKIDTIIIPKLEGIEKKCQHPSYQKQKK